ncbi:MAG: tetratricopeptide repeat protein [Flavobacteriia bacterium]|nr:tetratricopeptide repeat protein [Flavobacteriia bacterium]
MKHLLSALLLLPILSFSQDYTEATKPTYMKEYWDSYVAAPQETLEQLDSIIAATPSNATARTIRALCLFQMDRGLEGSSYLENTVTLFPDSIEPRYTRGMILYNTNLFGPAEKDFLRLVNNENLPNTLIYECNQYLSQIYSSRGDFTKALEHAHIVYQHDTSFFGGVNLIAEIYMSKGNFEEAMYWLQKALKMKPENLSLHSNLGFIYQLQERHQEAVEEFNYAVPADSISGYTYNNRAYSLMKLGELKKALEDVNTALRINPMNTYAYRNRALIYIEMGEIDYACRDISSGIQGGFEERFGNELHELAAKYCQDQEERSGK